MALKECAINDIMKLKRETVIKLFSIMGVNLKKLTSGCQVNVLRNEIFPKRGEFWGSPFGIWFRIILNRIAIIPISGLDIHQCLWNWFFHVGRSGTRTSSLKWKCVVQYGTFRTYPWSCAIENEMWVNQSVIFIFHLFSLCLSIPCTSLSIFHTFYHFHTEKHLIFPQTSAEMVDDDFFY